MAAMYVRRLRLKFARVNAKSFAVFFRRSSPIKFQKLNDLPTSYMEFLDDVYISRNFGAFEHSRLRVEAYTLNVVGIGVGALWGETFAICTNKNSNA